jgi:cyanophycinase
LEGAWKPGGGPGRLIAVGGFAERTRERELLRAFFEAAGGTDANLVVLALTEPAELRDLAASAERFGDLFYDLGAESVEVLHLGAAGRAPLDVLEHATGAFLAGGGSSWLPFPDDSPLRETVQRRHAAGMVVGGSGAGAAVLPALSIAPAAPAGLGGLATPATPATPAIPGRRRALGLARGLGLCPGLLVDPPLRQRDRLGRLLAALAIDPALLAVGIDEDTALVVDPRGTLEVLGAGAALVVDATAGVHPGAADLSDSMLGVRVDVLTAGCLYDLEARQARPGSAHGASDRLVLEPGEPARDESW